MDKNRKKQYLLLLFTAILLTAAAVIFILRDYMSRVDNRIYLTSTTNLREVYSQVNNKLSQIVNEQWDLLAMSEDYIDSNADTPEAIVSFVDDWKLSWKFTDFYFINTAGEWCTPDGAAGTMSFGSAWGKLISKQEKVIVDADTQNQESFMLFAIPVDTGTYNGFSYDALAVSYSSDALNAALGVSAFRGQATCYITDLSGNIIFSDSPTKPIGKNLLNYLADAEFSHATYQKVQADWAANTFGQCSYLLNGEKYYLVYQPTDFSDWLLVSMIPADIIDSDMLIVQKTTTLMVGFTCVVILALAVIFMFMSYQQTISQKNQELFWRDIMSDIMLQNLDNVYIMIEVNQKQTVYVSPNVERVFGISHTSAHPLFAIQELELSPETLDFPIEDLMQMPNGGSRVMECQIRTPGASAPSLFQKSVFHILDGQNNLLIFEFSNRTHEQEIRADIEAALQAANTANQIKSAFLSNMSHDIRTPMNAIMGISSLLLHAAHNPAKTEEYARKIQSSSQYMLGIINDILDMSKIESGQTHLHPEPLNLSEQIEQIEMLIRPQAVQKKQTFSIYKDEILHEHIEGDPTKLRQILVNILSNAVKYTPEGGSIDFHIRELPRTLHSYARYQFTIKDNGIGIEADFLEHIYEPFVRAEDSVTNKVSGTGLGMAITKSLVDMMGGAIQIDSTPGKGTCFDVFLEFRINEETMAGSKPSAPDSADASARLAGMKLLCAEDNALNAEILKSILELWHVSCDIYPNGKELCDAFASARPGDYDLILMDIQMPVMNGYEATRTIRNSSNPLGQTIPIIAMTANAFADDVQQSLDAGMNAHLSKPIDIDKLYQTLQTMFG